ncbi:WRKY DNA-binding transcription factor 70 [Linum grandiflorum]
MGSSYFLQTMQRKQEMVIKELAQGHSFASQLQLLFKNENHPAAADELVDKILASFTSGISDLSAAAASTSDQAVEQQSSVSGMYEDSGESCRKRPAATAVGKGGGGRDNRGSYKRRRSGHSDVLISSSMQDGHSWRKYGQKEILNAKFPRSYYRCTHKFDQACKATRQVQRLEEQGTNKETMYSITYTGHHTCRNLPTKTAPKPPAVEPPPPTMNVKQEILAVAVNRDDINNVNNEENPSEVTTEINDNVDMWMQGLESFEADQAEEAISNYGYDRYSNYGFYGQREQVLDMDFGVKDIDFENEFRFDYGESNGGIFL